jgi:hypothetical protein
MQNINRPLKRRTKSDNGILVNDYEAERNV